MIKARPSLSAIHSTCAGSIQLVNSGLPGQAAGEPAALGTWLHRVIGAYIQTGEIPAAFASDDARFLFYRAKKMLEEGSEGVPAIKPYLIGITEVEVLLGKGTPTEGTADLLSWCPDARRLCIVDFKSGYLDKDATPQLLAYAGNVIAERNIDPVELWLCRAQLRTGTYHWNFTDKATVIAAREKLLANVKRAEEAKPGDLSIYSVGPQCVDCPVAMHCGAQAVALRPMMAMANVEGGEGKINLAGYSDAQLSDFRAKLKLVKKFVEAGEDALKVRAANIPIRLASGKSYGKTEVQKNEWDGPATVAMIKSRLKPGVAINCIKVIQKALKAAVEDEAAKGQKGAAWKEFQEDAQKCGALSKKAQIRFGEIDDEPEELE